MSKNAWKTDEIGPWNNEPDSKDFTAHELHCALRRNSSGAWCGYVGVPKEHPLYGVGYDQEIKAPQERIDRTNINIGAFALLFASSYFSTITPQGGSQNVIFVASDYLTQRELYRLGLLTTIFCTLVFLLVGTPWVLWVGR